MSRSESYTGKTFVVDDSDTRIRSAANLMEFERYTAADTLPPGETVGNFKRIPNGAKVKVDQVKVVLTGSSGLIIFAHALAADGTTEYGWTSTRNLAGGFINETLGELPPEPGANKFGPNAAWKEGEYDRQLTLVSIVDVERKIKRIALDTLDAYLDLVESAAHDNVLVAINSGFRSYGEQKYLYDGFKAHLSGFNKAAKPGFSNHQNGIAFDIEVAGSAGNPIYDWLKKHAPALGFLRTVNGEPWHWEYDPNQAAAAVAAHTYKTSHVLV